MLLTRRSAELRQSLRPTVVSYRSRGRCEGTIYGLIASGWHTCGIAMRLAADAALRSSESFASPGLAPREMAASGATGRRAAPARHRDQNAAARKAPEPACCWRWQLYNAHNAEVLDLEATSLLICRRADLVSICASSSHPDTPGACATLAATHCGCIWRHRP